MNAGKPGRIFGNSVTICIVKCKTMDYNYIDKENNVLFEWDIDKEQSNIKKHGIGFDAAATVFSDPNRKEFWDEKHSSLYENRYITIGRLRNAIILLTVVYTDRRDFIRIITARLASKEETEIYYGYYDYKMDRY